MKGDFTRDTFDPSRHYNSVLMQQGRVQLDADWNEQTAIILRRDQTTAADLIGDCGGPGDNAAFGISAIAGVANDFLLSAGRYYVDGIQCELETPIKYSEQPDRQKPLLNPPVAPATTAQYLIYLDVWQRHITALEQSKIREPALGGPDTATRLKTVWQVRAVPHNTSGVAGTALCGAPNSLFTKLTGPSSALLSAKTVAAKVDDDPCILPESAGYTGLENQLYRVEIHQGSMDQNGAATKATYKWSRENGSVVTALTKITGTILTVISLGQDDPLGFRKGSFVEILDDALELEGKPGQLIEVADFNPDNLTLTLKSSANPLGTGTGFVNGVNPSLNPRLRRWEGTGDVAPPAAAFVTLEAGIQIQFKLATANFRNGDYWQIPARAAAADAPAGDIEWPRELDSAGRPDPNKPIATAPRGIEHHYCQLGVVSVPAATTPPAPPAVLSVLTDCRCLWPNLTQVPRLFYLSGDGQEVAPIPGSAAAVGTFFKLPNQLIVGVANGHCIDPTKRLRVRFSVTAGSGNVRTVAPDTAAQVTSFVIGVRVDGTARCEFLLDATTPNQQVTARLVDVADKPLSLPIIFNANLSIASQVAYLPGTCAGLTNQKTVQDAISRLATMASVYQVSGDGQQGAPSVKLASPVRVRVASRCGPVPGMTVSFKPLTGGLPTPVSPATTFVTDANGEVACDWQLGSTPVLQVLEVEIAGDTTTDPRKVHFLAHLTGENSSNDTDPVRVVGLRYGKPTQVLKNGQNMTVSDLSNGLFILVDKPLDSQTIIDPTPESNVDQIFRVQPTCFLTAEVPYPLPRENFGAFAGYHPLVLLGRVTNQEITSTQAPPPALPVGLTARGLVTWNGIGNALPFLSGILSILNTLSPHLDKLLVRLTLKGNFIWSSTTPQSFPAKPAGFLDGDAFRAPPGNGESELLLPSGDQRRGGDFEMWFWLVPPTPTKTIEVKLTDKTTEKTIEVKVSDKTTEKTTEVKLTDKTTEKTLEKGKETDTKATDKVAEKTTEKAKETEVKVTDAILGGGATPIVRGVSSKQPQSGEAPGKSFIKPEERPQTSPPPKKKGKRK